jgi:DNA gyrase subunit A
MMVVTFSRDGYVKRVPLDVYRTQSRGGRGIIGSEAKEGDLISSLFVAGTHDYVLCFSNRGQVYWLKVYNLPEGSRTSAGRAISNLIQLAEGERVTNVLRVPEFEQGRFVFFATRRGTVKKTALEAFSRPKKGGIRAILLEEQDEVVGVGLCKVGDTIVLATANGQAIRFDEKAARTMGRTSYGVRGIRLLGDDVVVDMIVAEPATFLLSACENGYGKRTPIDDYPVKGRGGQGVINIRTEGRNGRVVGVVTCREADEVLLITQAGMLVRSPVNDMRPMGRNTQGVRLVNLKDGDRLVGIEIVSAQDLEQYAATSVRRRPPLLELEEREADADAEEGEPEEPSDGEEASDEE